ncbi:hypothetical protein M0R89_08645 [Halorussus limi]|uniref:Uncharacterized protein n=1 Tax=Halorussus limi TaxID=2938695 RepID=A0A8U0HYU5_9EURY|nr:hypothetical protein [Halorussus limi]UPV76107.1 hypothetical protein M0R89_08645 [Halorussus limi]
MSDASRRELLRVGVAGLATAFTGCTTGVQSPIPSESSPSSPSSECRGTERTTIDFEPVTLSENRASHLYPLVYSDLDAPHQRIVDRVRDSGRYAVCDPVPETTDSFVTLARNRVRRQMDEYHARHTTRPPGYLATAYLQRARSYFAFDIDAGDVSISDSDVE